MPQEQPIVTAYTYDHEGMRAALEAIMRPQLDAAAWQWLAEKSALVNEAGSNAFATAFAAMPRKTGKGLVHLDEAAAEQLAQLRSSFSIKRWTLDRVARTWLLLQLSVADKTAYIRRIEQLFPAAEMNELVALYGALPVLAYPEAWQQRCAEGIRSNIGPVLEAIICNNPYPAEQLGEGAWNQLVLKAFFTEKKIDEIIGLDDRANQPLADTLVDFSRERRAAGRAVPPMLWRCVAPFINADNIADLERALYATEILERDAAALACDTSNYEPAHDLLAHDPETLHAINTGALTWAHLAQRIS